MSNDTKKVKRLSGRNELQHHEHVTHRSISYSKGGNMVVGSHSVQTTLLEIEAENLISY